MKKSIQEIRDELAHKYAVRVAGGKEPEIGSTHGYELTKRELFEGDRESFKTGFNSGYKLAEERAAEREKILVEAMNKIIPGCDEWITALNNVVGGYDNPNHFDTVQYNFGVCKEMVESALEKYNQLRGGE